MTLRFHNGKLFMPDGSFRDGDLAVENDRIVAIGDAFASGDSIGIDLDGRWVLPGFIDLHLHLNYVLTGQEAEAIVALQGAHHAWQTLASGVTTVRDVGGYRQTSIVLKRAIDSGWVPGPRVLSCGQFIMITGGHEYHQGVEADGPDEILRAVRTQIKAGAEWIKLMASGGVGGDESPAQSQMTFEEIRAAVIEAGRFGKSVAVHAHPATTIKEALRAGAASIEHGTFLDDECIELMRRTGAFLVPTIAAYESIANSTATVSAVAKRPDLFLTATHAVLTAGGEAIAKQVVKHKLGTLKEVVQQGIRWGVGTDSSGLHLPHGRFSSELRLLHEAGLDRTEILLQATKVNAQLLDMDDKIGTLETGKFADFVILEADPTQDLAATEQVYGTVKAGRIYWPHGFPMHGMNMNLAAMSGEQSSSEVSDGEKTRI